MKNLTKRQEQILDIIRKNEPVSTKYIKQQLEKNWGKLNRATVIRDLDTLLEKELIKKEGKGRGTYYRTKTKNKLLQYFDPENYFQTPPDDREIKNAFDLDIFKHFSNEIFSKDELEELDDLNNNYRQRVNQLSKEQLKKEFERLTIELSWKSSRIEGNTYSLINTEILLKENKEAEGHTREEAQMIINHKKALDHILDKRNDFKKLNTRKIEDLHKLIVDKIGVETNFRKRLVGITGTKFKPLDNQHQIREAMEEMIKIVNNKDLHPLLRSMASILLTSYIQPFEDGNKRTARLLGNAVLLAHDYCPLSYRSINESDYKKATLLFYEQNSALFFKELFTDQFKFSINNYFLI
jgi:Fic family protein